jgi:flagellar biosynthesis/type III secretory pathway protein FliH
LTVSDDVDQAHARGILLFDEDFDAPAPPPSPPAELEVIEPVFTAAELQSAREEASRESREAALAEQDASARAVSARALTDIGAAIAAMRVEILEAAEQSAEATARLLIDCFAASFPALSSRHGPREVTAVLKEILPALHREPKITIRVNPHLLPTLTEELHTLDGDLAASVRLIPTDAVALGDVRIAWEQGSATRDSMSLWKQIENILAPAGLVKEQQTAKEKELVE